MDDLSSTFDGHFRFVRRIVVYRWRLIVAALLMITLPTLAWVIFAMPHKYETSATLFMAPEKSEQPSLLREFMMPEVNSLYLAILRSRSLAQAVTEALPKESRDELTKRTIFRDYLVDIMNHLRRWTGGEVLVHSPSELAVRELQDARMTFNVSKDGSVAITALAYSPRVAVDLANTYVDVLLSRSGQFARQQARGTRELLENLLQQSKATQGEAGDSLRKFQAKSGVVKLPDEAKLDLVTLGRLEGQLADVQVGREIAQNRLAYLRGDRQRPAGLSAAADPAAQYHREKLIQLEAKLAALKDKYTDQHPAVVAVHAEIHETQANLKAAVQPAQAPRPAGATALKPQESAQLAKQMADLEVEIISAQAKEGNLQHRIGRVKRSLSTMSASEQEYSELARSAATQAKLADTLAEKLTAARISEQSQLRNLQVIDLASVPHQPSPKGPLKILLFGLLGGLVIGLGVATIREYTEQVVETEQQVVEVTGLPVLGSIPLAERSAPINGAEQDTGPVFFVASSDERGLPADACRALRTSLDCLNLDPPLRTLLVTSASAHEGKSTVLLNLSRAFLETGRRLVIVDGDLRRPTLHTSLRIPNETGLAEMLREGVVRPETFRAIAPNLEFVPAGIASTNPSALLSSKNMTNMLEIARERADLVLVDAPPVLAVSDCMPLCRQVDGVLLIARFGVTQRGELLRAKTLLEKVGARVVGVVVNGLSQRETRNYYAAYTSYVGATKTDRKKTDRKGKRRK